MLRLRPYKLSDSKCIVSWIKDEQLFVMWCANKFKYPLTEEQLNEYKENYEKESIHLGFLIVDSSIRGNGYGKEMLRLVIKYAFEILNVSRITLEVFDNNPAAHYCYKSVGFVDRKYYEEVFPYKNEKWGVYDMEISKFQK